MTGLLSLVLPKPPADAEECAVISCLFSRPLVVFVNAPLSSSFAADRRTLAVQACLSHLVFYFYILFSYFLVQGPEAGLRVYCCHTGHGVM